MRDIKKTLRNSRGMTLLEVMMAVAVFGIILLFITRMTNTSSHITADNSDQVRMMELARAEAERIKAAPRNFPLDTNRKITYPPGSEGDKIEEYAIMYQKESSNDGNMLKITVGPVANSGSAPLEINNPENYVLVTWIPPESSP